MCPLLCLDNLHPTMQNYGLKVGTFPINHDKANSIMFGQRGILSDPSALMSLLPRLCHLLVSPIDDNKNPINSSGNATLKTIWGSQSPLIDAGRPVSLVAIQQRNRSLINNFCSCLALAMVFNTAILPSKLPNKFKTDSSLTVIAEHLLLSPEGRQECLRSTEYDEDVDVIGHFIMKQLQKKMNFGGKKSYSVILYLAMKADYYINLKIITEIVLKNAKDDDTRIKIRLPELYATPKTACDRIKTIRQKMGFGVYDSFETMLADHDDTSKMLVTEFVALWPFIMGNIRENAKPAEMVKMKAMFKGSSGDTLRLLHKWCKPQDGTGHLFITDTDEEAEEGDDTYGCPPLKFK